MNEGKKTLIALFTFIFISGLIVGGGLFYKKVIIQRKEAIQSMNNVTPRVDTQELITTPNNIIPTIDTIHNVEKLKASKNMPYMIILMV